MAHKLHILALEPDQACGRRLREMVANRLGADVVVVPNAEAAIARLSSRFPDAILTSTLLPPQQEALLHAHLRQLDDRSAVPVLMVPPVSDLSDGVTPRKGLFSLARRTRTSPMLYDAAAITARIEDAIAESRRQQSERVPDQGDAVITIERSLETIVKPTAGANVRQFRAPRCAPDEVGWLSGARTSFGLPLRIVNISGSGMLIEASDKISSGSATEIQLYGPDRTIVVPSRVVRAEVAGVNTRGVKYHMAAVFNEKLDLVRAAAGAESPASPRALADLLSRVSSQMEHGLDAESVRAAFEEGLRRLVPAREIKLRDVPAIAAEGESVYFKVPSTGGSPAILQVTFEPDYEPVSREFKLLKASATAAAIILMYQEP
jgi:PilZ domain